MVVFITKLRMNFAFFPLAGPPESWGCWLTLQEMSQLVLCSVFQQPWSSRKWSQSIEGQVSVIFYYDMVLQSFFLFIAFYTLPGYKIIKIKINKNSNEKKNFPKPCIHSKTQHLLTLYRLASCWGITWSENQCSATLGDLKWGEKSKFKLWFFYGHFWNSFYLFLSHLKKRQLCLWFKNGKLCKVFSHTLCLLLNHMLICYATELLICSLCTSAVKEI